MSNTKDKIKGIVATVIFHVCILILLFVLGLSTPLPLPGEEGVEVSLGTNTGSTKKQRPEEKPASIPVPKKEEPNTRNDKVEMPNRQEELLSTQTVEDVPALSKVENKKTDTAYLKKKTERPKETPQPVVNQRALYKKRNSSDAGKAEQESDADIGSIHGTNQSTQTDGFGDMGKGISYNLGGRGAKHIPKPVYNSQEQGKIVVNIWVNREGVVTRAVDGAKGTNISDLSLRKLVRQAALKAQFTPDPDAPDIQKGTITYNFLRVN